MTERMSGERADRWARGFALLIRPWPLVDNYPKPKAIVMPGLGQLELFPLLSDACSIIADVAAAGEVNGSIVGYPCGTRVSATSPDAKRVVQLLRTN